ncbi:DUF1330 domain-containing protein [Embleya sp. NBC_00896]|uniref:DUF1330 domain-containing protein n=1 Tax=Embleya sp. NBC_00896 TaxID=2975961 RepID=UPI00386F24B4|nr:DUF1330 domain-containing protein [Embleya sp. NBC_00896]
MTAYAIAQLTINEQHPDIQVYIDKIQATMDPFQGRFLVHGGKHELLEGEPNPDYLVMLEFPSTELAKDWYASPAYLEILPLRTDHISGTVIVVEGVPEGYRTGA